MKLSQEESASLEGVVIWEDERRLCALSFTLQHKQSTTERERQARRHNEKMSRGLVFEV